MIVVYDVTNGESFVNVKRWLQEIDQNCDVVNRILGEWITDAAVLIVCQPSVSSNDFRL